MGETGINREITTTLKTRFVDDDEFIRTGRAMLEVDGHSFLHIPVDRDVAKEFRENSREVASLADSAKTYAEDATSAASQAADSEANAERDADRAAQIADSTSWDGDKLTVNGKTSPSLTGPKGEPGEVSQKELNARLSASPYNSITVKTEAEAQALSGLRKGDYVHVLDTGNVYIWE